MADIRIKVAKDKAKLVKALRAGEGSTGPFQSYVEVLIFAASLGLNYDNYISFEEASRKDPDPIPWENFTSKNQDKIIDLISVTHTRNPKILEDTDECERERAKIFEGYANGGLALIQQASGENDNFLFKIQMLLTREKNLLDQHEDSINLDFLSL